MTEGPGGCVFCHLKAGSPFKPTTTVALKSVLRGDQSLSSGLLLRGKYLSANGHVNIGLGWLGAEQSLGSCSPELLQRTG